MATAYVLSRRTIIKVASKVGRSHYDRLFQRITTLENTVLKQPFYVTFLLKKYIYMLMSKDCILFYTMWYTQTSLIFWMTGLLFSVDSKVEQALKPQKILVLLWKELDYGLFYLLSSRNTPPLLWSMNCKPDLEVFFYNHIHPCHLIVFPRQNFHWGLWHGKLWHELH